MPPPPKSPLRSARADWWWIFDPRYSLRARAMILVVGSTLVFTAIATWVAGAIFHRELENQIGTSFELLAVQIGNKLDRAVHADYAQLAFAASQPRFRANDAPREERRQLLQSLESASPDFAWIGLMDSSGRVIVSTQPALEGESAAARPWFNVAVNKGNAAGLDAWPALVRLLPRSESDEEPSRYLVIATGVTGPNGEFLGVLAAQLRWDWAREVQASVITEAVRRLNVGATVYAAAAEVLVDSGNSGWTRPPNAPDLPGSRAHGVLLEKSAIGTAYVTGYARTTGYREYRGPAWLVTVRQPVGDAYAPVAQLQRSLVRWALLVVVACAALTWVYTGRLTRRLRSVTAAARMIQRGDLLTVMPGAHGETDVDEMCGAVSELVEQLRPKQDSAATIGTEAHLKSRPPSDQIHRLV
jgi:HAMP domain-containing protein